MIRAYWQKKLNNFGDILAPVILEHFTGQKVEFAKRGTTGKVLTVGSILYAMRENDIVWGTGLISEREVVAPKGVRFLAVRGPLTRKNIRGAKVPRIYGDPCLLMPLVYKPEIEKIYDVGVVLHYADVPFVDVVREGKFIDICAGWREVVEEVLACRRIISSSLHGIICAEAYGIPVVWKRFGDRIIGGEFKFQDYFLGTGRKRQKTDVEIPPIKDLERRQGALIKALKGIANED